VPLQLRRLNAATFIEFATDLLRVCEKFKLGGGADDLEIEKKGGVARAVAAPHWACRKKNLACSVLPSPQEIVPLFRGMLEKEKRADETCTQVSPGFRRPTGAPIRTLGCHSPASSPHFLGGVECAPLEVKGNKFPASYMQGIELVRRALG
jgi:hypothetical protein